MNLKQNFKFFKLKAFSLLEVSIYIAIVGVFMLSLAKAKDVMLNAKIQATVMQMQSIIIDEENTLNAESPKIGGTFILENNELILAKNANKEGLLNEKTASKFKSQLASCTLTKQPNDLYIISIQLL